MHRFSRISERRLHSCHPALQHICNELIGMIDFTVLEGYRSEVRQKELYSEGLTKVQYPESKHNQEPSKAIDIAPYPIDWKDTKRFFYLAGMFMGVANKLGIKVRWGGDWDRDNNFNDQSFNDLVHFELME